MRKLVQKIACKTEKLAQLEKISTDGVTSVTIFFHLCMATCPTQCLYSPLPRSNSAQDPVHEMTLGQVVPRIGDIVCVNHAGVTGGGGYNHLCRGKSGPIIQMVVGPLARLYLGLVIQFVQTIQVVTSNCWSASFSRLP